MVSSLQRTLRRLRYGEPVIVVSGLPRSGTSMAMKMLDAAGIPTVSDGIRTADEDNPKGYFEDERVKDLAQMKDKSWLKNARGRSIKIIASLLPHLPQENNYKVILMNRNIEEVLASQAKMLERRGESSDTDDTRMRELYKEHMDKVHFVLKYRPSFEMIEVHYKDVLDDPQSQAARIRDFLGKPLDVRKMAGVVDESLYRNRAETQAPSH
jgi:hypothetical protein